MKETLSFSFYSKNLNDNKYQIFKTKAEEIRSFKNQLSLEISGNLGKYLNYSKFDLVKEFGTIDLAKEFGKNTSFKNIRGNELQKAAADVYDSYANKFDAINKKLQFKVQKNIKRTYYKINRGAYKFGDIKEFKVEFKSTKLTKVMTYLARYGSPDILEYIESLPEKHELHNDVIFYCGKFGLERLLNLAVSKKRRLFLRYNRPIVFNSLSYRTGVQNKDILLQKHIGFTNAYIVIKGVNGIIDGKRSRNMIVPVNCHSKYHGKIEDFKSQEYTIKVEPHRIRFLLTKEVDKEYSTGANFIGVDTNIKHNLFSCSNGTTIDLDRKMLKDYTNFLKKIDNKNNCLTTGEAKQKKLRHTRFHTDLKRLASKLVKSAILSGKDHIVMEDLGIFDKGYSKNDEFNNFKYSRLVRLLHFSSLNRYVRSIVQKNGLQLTLIPAHYTSQLCSKCGNISRDNRQTQESFKCTVCGEEFNADFNSSINIHIIGEYEARQEVLAGLLKEDKAKWLVPKTKNKFKIREHLENIVSSSAFQLNRENLLGALAS